MVKGGKIGSKVLSLIEEMGANKCRINIDKNRHLTGNNSHHY